MSDLFQPDTGQKKIKSTETASATMPVLLPLALDEAFSYRSPDKTPLPAGTVVAVPLGAREAVGVVWDDEASPAPAGSLKPILHAMDAPPLTHNLRRFIDWVARYTHARKFWRLPRQALLMANRHWPKKQGSAPLSLMD